MERNICSHYQILKDVNHYCFDCEMLYCINCSSSHTNHDFTLFPNNSNDTFVSNDELMEVENLLSKYSFNPNESYLTYFDHSSAAQDEITGEEWKCKVCTTINNLNRRRCMNCPHFLEYRNHYEEILQKAPYVVDLFKTLEKYHVQYAEVVIEEYLKNTESLQITDWYKKSYSQYPDSSTYKMVLSRRAVNDYPFTFDEMYNGILTEQNVKLQKDLSCIVCFDGPTPLRKINEQILILNGTLRNDIVLKQEDMWRKLLSLAYQNSLNRTTKRMLSVELFIKEMDKLEILPNLVSTSEFQEYYENKPDLKVLQTALVNHFEVDGLLNYLINACPLCLDNYTVNEMITMEKCSHSICEMCFLNHFIEAIDNQHPSKWICPFCQDNEANDDCSNYEIDHPHKIIGFISRMFDHLEMKHKADKSLKLEIITVKEKFDRRLLEQELMHSSNFHWCPNDKCQMGFEFEGDFQYVQCPLCKIEICGKCGRKKTANHESSDCDDVKLNMLTSFNDPSRMLNEIGIECPNCLMRYELAAGGCLHFTCSRCGKEFCGGCYNYFNRQCTDPSCNLNTLHAHHPRTCIYYLRDEEIDLLRTMLQETEYNQLVFPDVKDCQLLVTESLSKKEAPCGKPVFETTGYCDNHYKEYLIQLINIKKIDPIDSYNSSEKLNLILYQNKLPKLKQNQHESNTELINRLKQEIKSKCAIYQMKNQKPN